MIACLSLNPALDVATSTAKVGHTSKIRCGPPRLDPGGGGINVARVIKTLDGEGVVLFTAGGHTGAKLVELVRDVGLRSRVIPIGGTTRESLTVEEAASGLQYRFVLPGPELTAEEQKRCAEALRELRPRPAFLVATGSLPPGAPADLYAKICRTAQALGVKTVLDTSGPALHAAYSGLYLMKPSLSELEEIAGARLATTTSQLDAARDIVRRGRSEIVVVSLGRDGALWVTKDEHELLPPIPVEPRSAVGAGDSMVAAITVGLVNGLALRDAVRFGMAAGAATVMTPGTELCRREDVEALFSAAYGAKSPL